MKPDEIIEYLYGNEVKNIIVDCDMGADGDDQFALAYALVSPDKVKVLSVNSAPFGEDPASAASQGAIECKEIISLSGKSVPVFKGSADYITRTGKPVESDAALNIRNEVMKSDKPVFAVVTGCCTNAASALALYPEIKDKLIIVWLALDSLDVGAKADEYNYHGDIEAGKLLFSLAENIVLVCSGKVVAPYRKTKDEVDMLFPSANPLASWLRKRYREITWAKGLWDLCAEGLLILPDACRAGTVPRPVFGEDGMIVSHDISRSIVAVDYNDSKRIIADCARRINMH